MVKRSVGKPLKYTTDFILKEAVALIDYINTPPSDNRPIPFLKDFCFKRGYGSQRIAEFAEVPEFAEALNIYKDKVETDLVFGGLTNKFNSFMVNNTLKNIAGWRDSKNEGNHTDITIIYGHRAKPTDSAVRIERRQCEPA